MKPLTKETLDAYINAPEPPMIMQEPTYIVTPNQYKYLEENGHIENGELTEKGYKLMFG